MKDEITVTSPLLPDLDLFYDKLKDIWNEKYITNNGKYLREFEDKLKEYLDIPYISVVNNGTSALLLAIKSLELTGEVITTPYTFVATSNALIWNNLTPVFVDVDNYGNIDPDEIEKSITDKTSAILAVHVYGNPCQVNKIQEIANKHKLKVIYDAAHAFGVKLNNESILNYGDVSILSFHATKTFNSIEGGAIVTKNKELYDKIRSLRNFGIISETEIDCIGINTKMDEVRAAYGILNLEQIDKAINRRKEITNLYIKKLKNINGISFFNDINNVKYNYSYFPIFIDHNYKLTRDELYEKLKNKNILSRKYFYPLITDFDSYKQYNLGTYANAHKLANTVLCLPLHTNLTDNDINKIIKIIKE